MPSQSFVPSITIPHSQTTGALSLHDYRRNLNQTPSPDEIGNLKKLKRKHGALNLNQTQPDIRAPGWAWDPVSASSAASSPPPLSPSYSMSAMSMLSSERDLGRELEGEGFETGTYSPELAAFQEKSTEYAVRARTGGSWRKMDTFRERLEQTPQIHEPAGQEESNNCSNSEQDTSMDDPMTIDHDGVSFQILNPRNSLRLARIVSYIEDMDYPLDSDEVERESPFLRNGEMEGIPEEKSGSSSPTLQVEDGISPDDASQSKNVDLVDLPSHPSMCQIQPYDRPPTRSSPGDEASQNAHRDIIGDAPNTPIPSISERLSSPQCQYYHYHSASEPTLSRSQTYQTGHKKTITDAGLSTNLYPDSGYQTKQVSPIYSEHGNFPADMFYNYSLNSNYSPHRDIFGPDLGIPSGYGASMQDFGSWDHVGEENMPNVVKKGPGRSRLTKKAGNGSMLFMKEGGGRRVSLLRPWRKLRDAVKAF